MEEVTPPRPSELGRGTIERLGVRSRMGGPVPHGYVPGFATAYDQRNRALSCHLLYCC